MKVDIIIHREDGSVISGSFPDATPESIRLFLESISTIGTTKLSDRLKRKNGINGSPAAAPTNPFKLINPSSIIVTEEPDTDSLIDVADGETD